MLVWRNAQSHSRVVYNIYIFSVVAYLHMLIPAHVRMLIPVTVHNHAYIYVRTHGRFKEIDREGLGKFNINQLSSFLREYDMPATTEAIRVLFVAMNTSGYGVMLSDFEQWIKGEL